MPGPGTGRNEAPGCPLERRSALPLALDTPRTADSTNHPQLLSLPPRPPQSTGATTAKEITNDKTFETNHYDDEMTELRSTNRER